MTYHRIRHVMAPLPALAQAFAPRVDAKPGKAGLKFGLWARSAERGSDFPDGEHGASDLRRAYPPPAVHYSGEEARR